MMNITLIMRAPKGARFEIEPFSTCHMVSIGKSSNLGKDNTDFSNMRTVLVVWGSSVEEIFRSDVDETSCIERHIHDINLL